MDSPNELMDEFEFRPITEGLGFHKKSPLQNKTEHPADLGLVEVSLTKAPLELQPRPETQPKAKVRQPLPRPGQPTVAPPLPPMAKPKLDFQLKPEVRGVQPSDDMVGSHLMKVPFNLPAAIIDGVVVVAIAILFLVAVLMVTKVDLMVVLTNAFSDLMTQISLALLVLSVMQIYVISLRSFFGVTLGDWAFDVQLGTSEQQQAVFYPLQVLWRSLLMAMTGVFVVPILSVLMRRDLALRLTGLQLYQRQD